MRLMMLRLGSAAGFIDRDDAAHNHSRIFVDLDHRWRRVAAAAPRH